MKYLRRFVWYIASRLFLIILILGLVVSVFYYAMNATNIYVVLKDGMSLRAQTIMQMDEGDELNRYFQQSYLEKDTELQDARAGNSVYADYNVRGIDHRLEMGFLWLWPWEDTARVEITERIPAIDGRAKGTTAEALVAKGGSSALYPPAWPSHRYRVQLAKENGQWRIKSLTLLDGN